MERSRSQCVEETLRKLGIPNRICAPCRSQSCTWRSIPSREIRVNLNLPFRKVLPSLLSPTSKVLGGGDPAMARRAGSHHPTSPPCPPNSLRPLHSELPSRKFQCSNVCNRRHLLPPPSSSNSNSNDLP